MPGTQGRRFSNISTNTTTTVNAGKGVLHTITINTKGAASNTCTVYDGAAAAANPIATIDTTSAVGTFVYDVAFATSLVVVTATGTAANLTVSYE